MIVSYNFFQRLTVTRSISSPLLRAHIVDLSLLECRLEALQPRVSNGIWVSITLSIFVLLDWFFFFFWWCCFYACSLSLIRFKFRTLDVADDTEMRFGGLISTSNIVKEETITVQSDSDLLWTISIKKLWRLIYFKMKCAMYWYHKLSQHILQWPLTH